MARDNRVRLSRSRIQAVASPHRSLPGLATRERRTGRPEVLLAALLAVLAGAGATWYGFLAHTRGHPVVRLAGALALTSGGLAAVLLATPLPRPAVPVPGGRGPSPPAAQAAAVGAGAAILGLLSMAVALIHFAVIDQHWAVYWLYGLFFIGPAATMPDRARFGDLAATITSPMGVTWQMRPRSGPRPARGSARRISGYCGWATAPRSGSRTCGGPSRW
jgi:hypothetical protein